MSALADTFILHYALSIMHLFRAAKLRETAIYLYNGTINPGGISLRGSFLFDKSHNAFYMAAAGEKVGGKGVF